jgi:hypothetical protein
VALPKPSFAGKTELARWVDEVSIGRGGRVSSTAFLPADGEPYLSVNAVELESLATIGNFYKRHFQQGKGPVAVSSLKVTHYNAASKDAGVKVDYDKNLGRWTFVNGAAPKDAYRHRANSISMSHCGVESISVMNNDASNRFARRLAGQPLRWKPHILP